MYYTLENFINYCDDMMIANEGALSRNVFYKTFRQIMKQKGYTSGKKTYQIIKDGDTPVLVYYYYDPDYAGTGHSEHDNGLTKSDKPYNDKMIRDIKDTIKVIKKEYPNMEIDEEDYRGRVRLIFNFDEPQNQLKDGRKIEYFKNTKIIQYEKYPDGREISYKLINGKPHKSVETYPNGRKIHYTQYKSKDVKCLEVLPNGKHINYDPRTGEAFD